MARSSFPLRRALAVGLAATALALTSCSPPEPVDPVGPAPSAEGAPAEEASPSASAPAAGSGAEADVVAQYEAARAAVDLAERTAGGMAFELDDEDGGNWEVRVGVENEEFEVVVDAAGTEVLRSERDDSLDGEDAGRLNGVQIGLSEAIGIAVSEYTGTARLDDADLTTEGDTVAWEIGFVDDVEIYLDVLDGRVIRVD